MEEIKTITFSSVPKTLEELKALPMASLLDPCEVAALTVAALCVYPENKDESIAMLNFLKGPSPLSEYDKSFLKDRFAGKDYVPRSFFKGATPENGYTAEAPYRIDVIKNSHSEDAIGEGYLTLYLKSGGADSQRPMKIRKKPSTGQWFLWDQMILADIRIPKALDPWA